MGLLSRLRELKVEQRHLKDFARLVFEKSIGQKSYVEVYVKLCSLASADGFYPGVASGDFKRAILNQVQTSFEAQLLEEPTAAQDVGSVASGDDDEEDASTVKK